MIVFHRLQSRFLITSDIAYRLLVRVSESKRSLKKVVNATKLVTLIYRSPNLNSVQKQGHK